MILNGDFGLVCDSNVTKSMASEPVISIAWCPAPLNCPHQGLDTSRTTTSGRQRPFAGAVWRVTEQSDFRLRRHLNGIVHLDSEVADGTLNVRVPKKQLHGAKVVHPPIDLHHISSQRSDIDRFWQA